MMSPVPVHRGSFRRTMMGAGIFAVLILFGFARQSAGAEYSGVSAPGGCWQAVSSRLGWAAERRRMEDRLRALEEARTNLERGIEELREEWNFLNEHPFPAGESARSHVQVHQRISALHEGLTQLDALSRKAEAIQGRIAEVEARLVIEYEKDSDFRLDGVKSELRSELTRLLAELRLVMREAEPAILIE